MAKGMALEVTPVEDSETGAKAVEIKMPGADSPHLVVEIVTDTETKVYDQGEFHQDLEMKIPLADDVGEYSVRVISVESTDTGEKRTLIAKS